MDKVFFFILIGFLSLTVSAQKKMKTPKKAIQFLKEFKEFDKFEEDLMLEYSGISDELYKPELTKLINLAADDFIEIAKKETPTRKAYWEKIKDGLVRFSDIYPDLSANDIQRIIDYYEELMDFVDLRSSNGELSKFKRGIGFRRN
ncbi:MAG: DUF4844 domain-containing protein [Flavobacteriaceae bacterium]